MIQWLGLHTFTAEGPVSIPGQRTKISQAVQHGQKKKKRKDLVVGGRFLNKVHFCSFLPAVLLNTDWKNEAQ